jgi:anaerobic magnesium-protoporphyrin IX monomethyl ester cyclase
MRKPKIALIITPMPFVHDQKRNAPLGVMYVAAVLEQEKYDVSIVDLRDMEIPEAIKSVPDADIYGFSASSLEYNIAVEIAEGVKELHKKSMFVLGGFHATISPTEKLSNVFDVILKGEGEKAVLDIVELWPFDGSQLTKTAARITDLSALPYPARHLLPFNSIFHKGLVIPGNDVYGTTLTTSRGCPHECSFCGSRQVWGRRITYNSVDRVIGEIEDIITNYGVRQFRFYDDTITLNKKRLKELSYRLAPLKIEWRCHARTDELDAETCKMLVECGCDEVAVGVESASQEALNSCGKKVTVAQNKLGIKTAKENGLKVKAFFIIGLPKDFGDVSQRDIDFIEECQLDAVNLSTLSPFPGSKLYDNPAAYGLKFRTGDISKYKMCYGLWGNEADEDFAFEYDEMNNEELKYHRRKLLEYIKEKGLDLNK